MSDEEAKATLELLARIIIGARIGKEYVGFAWLTYVQRCGDIQSWLRRPRVSS
jgi:hypothetical protein